MATATVKVDLRRELRQLWAPPREPVLVEVPELPFLMVDGRGDPNGSPAFTEAIAALFSLSYRVKFALRGAGLRRLRGDAARRPVVEGVELDGHDRAAGGAHGGAARRGDRGNRGEAAAARALEGAAGTARRGLSAQALHVGPYVAEGPTIERLHAFIAANGFEPRGRHHELYLGDPRRAAPEKLRTVARQPVRAAR